MSGQHAVLSPSSAHRWVRCPGSVALIATLPPEDEALESATDPTFEGTVAHDIGADALETGVPAATFVGTQVEAPDGTVLTVDEDMCAEVQKYVDFVHGRFEAMMAEWVAKPEGPKPRMLVEVEVPISEFTHEPDATGTSDVVLIGCQRLEVFDLKFGRGVRVDAKDNWQLRAYVLGVLSEYSYTDDIRTVVSGIAQPRLDHFDEHTYAIEELQELADALRGAAALTHAPTAPRVPGPEQCKFCRAKAICPEKREMATELVWDAPAMTGSPDDFDVIATTQPVVDPCGRSDEWLSVAMQHVDLIEGWCRAVRAEVERRLTAQQPVPHFKLVQGKKGNREWDNPAEVEEALKKCRLKTEQMYSMKLISPTTAEKLHKAGHIGPRQWKTLQTRITQTDGRPSVAHENDPRPALDMRAAASDFDDVSTPKE